jgi:predicted DNA-binding helix-hairpin-helix protein
MKPITKLAETLDTLTRMGDVTLFEPAGDQPLAERRAPRYQSRSIEECITNVSTPKGPKPVLKAMVTTACERNCNYCPFRAGRSKTQRVTFTPDAIAAATVEMTRKRQVEGLFLSSGIIKGGVTTQDKILDAGEILRKKHRYRGYIHLKIMPGAEYDQLLRAMQIADRVSINLEGPTQERLEALAPKKQFNDELLRMLLWADRIRRENPNLRLASTVTQFVVGAVGDTDLELLSLSDHLYRSARLSRVYYSAFSPVIQTPFESLSHTEAIRERRLYQASFLLRDYAWNVEDLPFAGAGNLNTHIDPKTAWAQANLRDAPVDVMRAERDQLLRIPGVGPQTADKILKARRERRLTDLKQLRDLGMNAVDKAAPFILLDGTRPPVQMPLF